MTGSRAQIALAAGMNRTERYSNRRTIRACRTYLPPARSASTSRSGELTWTRSGPRQHATTVAMPTNDRALSANTQPAPTPATRKPPMAGPTARAMFIFKPLSAAAWGRSPRSTRSGWIACHAGLATALPQPSAKVSARISVGDASARNVDTASAAAARNIASWAPSSSFRRSTTSAQAPAGRASSTIGRLAAVCTNDTSSGEVSISSHCAPTVCIHVPTFDANCAIHSARKTGK